MVPTSRTLSGEPAAPAGAPWRNQGVDDAIDPHHAAVRGGRNSQERLRRQDGVSEVESARGDHRGQECDAQAGFRIRNLEGRWGCQAGVFRAREPIPATSQESRPRQNPARGNSGASSARLSSAAEEHNIGLMSQIRVGGVNVS
jgi:hypothetical protein